MNAAQAMEEMMLKEKIYNIEAKKGKISMRLQREDAREVVSDHSRHLGCGRESYQGLHAALNSQLCAAMKTTSVFTSPTLTRPTPERKF